MSAAPGRPQASSRRSSQSEGTAGSAAFSICVYCGSRSGAVPEYRAAAVAIGTWIARHGGQLVYGGGRSGLMGVVADATLEAGGTAIGIIPTALVEKERAHDACTELHVVATMHERKRMMAERADIFLALPGGIGTFEELFEVWTWRQLGYHDKPIGLLNVAGYYDPLLGFLRSSVDQQFMDPWQMALIHTGTDPESLLPVLIQAAGITRPSKLDSI